MPMVPGMENINFAPVIANIIYWLGMGLLTVFVLGGMWFVYRMFTFNIKVTIYPLYGSGDGDKFFVGKPKYNRVRWINNHTAWLAMKPLLNKKEREPFEPMYVYPGNQVIAYEIDNEWIPAKHEIDVEHAELSLKQVPHSMRNWQSQVHKRNAEKYAKIDFWSENKYLFITLGCIIACCVICGVTVYLTYKFAAGGTNAINGLSDAIRNMNVIQGVAPG